MSNAQTQWTDEERETRDRIVAAISDDACTSSHHSERVRLLVHRLGASSVMQESLEALVEAAERNAGWAEGNGVSSVANDLYAAAKSARAALAIARGEAR